MNASSLLLENYFFTEMTFKSNPRIKLEDCKITADDLKVSVRECHDEVSNRRWVFELRVDLPQIPARKLPYTFRLVLVGIFDVDEGYPKEKATLLARVNGPSVLYSAAREAIATMTGRGPYPAILLPPVNFLPAANMQDKKKGSMKSVQVKKAKRNVVRRKG